MVEIPNKNNSQEACKVDSFIDPKPDIIEAKVAELTSQLHPILQEKLTEARQKLNCQPLTGGPGMNNDTSRFV